MHAQYLTSRTYKRTKTRALTKSVLWNRQAIAWVPADARACSIEYPGRERYALLIESVPTRLAGERFAPRAKTSGGGAQARS